MSFRRPLVVFGVTADPARTLRVLKRVAQSEHTHVLLLQPERADLDDAQKQIQTARDAFDLPATYALLETLDITAIIGAAKDHGADVIVFSEVDAKLARARFARAFDIASKHGWPVVSVAVRDDKTELTKLSLVLDRLSVPAMALALARFPTAEVEALVEHEDPEVTILLEALVPSRPIHSKATAMSVEVLTEHDADLLVVASDSISNIGAVALGFRAAAAIQNARVSTLVWPRLSPNVEQYVATDALVLDRCFIAVERKTFFGRAELTADDPCVLRYGNDALTVFHDRGVIEPPRDWLKDKHAVSVGSAAVRVWAPAAPFVLVDSACRHTYDNAVRVRMRNDEPIDRSSFIIDASAWLDDGGADDLPRQVDKLRLARVAQRLRDHGARISRVIDADNLELQTPSAVPELVPGNDIEIHLDNTRAREALLGAIRDAKSRIHWQCYIVDDDPIGRRFEEALIAAHARGVAVRLMFDALYSGHDAFGAKNPLIERLVKAGVEARAFRPLLGVPNIEALKQRNHKKCIIIDNEVAVVTGRNFGAPYYTGFEEAQLTRTSSYRDVPWLDAGARVRGPLVSAVDRSFQRDWLAAGGSPFAIVERAPEGSVTARFITHDGLRDTATFDAQLGVIRNARSSLLVVNTFPLAVELQRALINAVKRGVAVKMLFGSVRPHFGEEQSFAGGSFRALADSLVRSRIDAVVKAGGEAYEFALPWEGELQRVFAHVHAKLIVADRSTLAIGSANLDVTAAYWESEAMLVCEDATLAASVEDALSPRLATSRRFVSASDWLGRHWPSLIG